MGTASAGIILWARNAPECDEEDKPDERSVRVINLKFDVAMRKGPRYKQQPRYES